jgi:hypothetical protein
MQIKDPTRQRNFRDLITSDSWKEYNTQLSTLEAGEINKLVNVARTEDIDAIKHQVGVIDGVQRVISLTQKLERGLRNSEDV